MPLMSDEPPRALAASAFHAPVAHMGLRFGLVSPVVTLALQWESQRRWHLGAKVQSVVWTTGFQQQHAHVGVFGQASSQHIAGGARTNDDVVVVFFCCHRYIFFRERGV